MTMHGKVVLIAGASGEIGRAVTRAFADEGAMVYAADLVPTQPAHPFGVEELRLDVASEIDWARSVAAIIDETGRLDVLINHVGDHDPETTGLLDIEKRVQRIARAQAGAFLGMHAAARTMRQHKAGSVINVSPTWASTGMAAALAVQASHGAFREISKHAAAAYAADGIRVNTVLLGYAEARPTGPSVRELNGSAKPTRPVIASGLPAQVASACLFLTAERSSRMNGAELLFSGDAEPR